MGQETKRTISIAIGVAAGILISNVITFIAGLAMANIASKAAMKELAEFEREAKSARIESQVKHLKETRKQRLYEEMRKKEGSDLCRFWRQQIGKNENAEEKIKQHCYTGPDPSSL